MQKKPWPLDTRTISNLIVVLIGILFYFVLYRFDVMRDKISMVTGVLSPFIIGFAIAYLLNTPTTFFEEKVYCDHKHSRTLAIVTVYLLAAAVLAILLNLILPQVWSSAVELVNNMSTYMRGLDAFVQELIIRFNLEGDSINEMLTAYQNFVQSLTSIAIEKVSAALPQILNLGVAVGSGVISALTAFIASIYMLSGKNRLVPQLKKLIYAAIPKKKASWFLGVCGQANRIFVGFINGKLIDSAIIGVLCFVLNLILQIPYNTLIAVIIGVTNVIPFFGPIIGAVPCIMILIIVDPWAALRFAVLVLALQQFDGNILGPKILGDSTGLSAIWVLVSIVVCGGLFGFPGMLLGVPTFAVLYALVREWVNHRLEKKGIDGNGEPLPGRNPGGGEAEDA
ncbi:AI-2E family transporter [Intestinimonas sp.]|uniref:AI-2E family transporter n=1 Tax=Intestinimonas sp. TaxID=1965293 RepID=UPI002628B3AC|nr:AI-2E family transporter [Intestinimonas sp.]